MACDASQGIDARRFLFQTWNPTIYLENRFLYAIGNTPAENIIEDYDFKKKQLDILLLGAGDVRHVLKTTGEQSAKHDPWHVKTRPKKLNFVLNDIDDVLVARNIIILDLCQRLNVDDDVDMTFLWSIWYNMKLTVQQHDRLIGVIDKLLKDAAENQTSGYWSFGDDETKAKTVDIWKTWLKLNVNTEEVSNNRKIYHESKGILLSSIGNQYLNARSLDHERNVADRFREQHFEWRKSGVFMPSITKVTEEVNCEAWLINPTMMRVGSNLWHLHYGADPVDSFKPFDIEEIREAGGNVYQACFVKMKKLARNFQQALTGVSISVSVWLGDALFLCSYEFPKHMAFDVIHTSNLMDHLGPLNLLLCCKSRLKSSSSILLTESMKWASDKGTLAEYLTCCLGCSIDLFPTVHGYRLAEDIEIGNCFLQRALSSVSKIAWMLAERDTTPINLEESECLVGVVRAITKLCSEYDVPFSTREKVVTPATPVALLAFAENFGKSTTEGVQAVLSIIDETIRDSYRLQWNIIKEAFGYSHNSEVKLCAMTIPSNFEFPSNSIERIGFSQLSLLWMFECAMGFMGLMPNETSNNVIINFVFNAERRCVTIPVLESYFDKGVTKGSRLLVDVQPFFGIPLSYVGGTMNPVILDKKTLVPSQSNLQQSKVSANQLQLKYVKEFRDRYDVEITCKNDGQKMTLSCESLPLKHFANIFVLSIAFGSGKRDSTTLTFANYFTDDAVMIRFSNKKGSIALSFPKLVTTQGRHIQPLCRLDVSKLPKLTRNPSQSGGISIESLMSTNGTMFAADGVKKHFRTQETVKDASFNFRESLQVLWNFYYEHPEKRFFVFSRDDHTHYTQYDGEALGLYVMDYCWYQGLPLMHVKWLDWRPIFQLAKNSNRRQYQEIMYSAEQSVYQTVGSTFGHFRGGTRQNIDPEVSHKLPSFSNEHEYFRTVLELNSKRLNSPLTARQPWKFRDSFLQVYFPFMSSLMFRALKKSNDGTDHVEAFIQAAGNIVPGESEAEMKAYVNHMSKNAFANEQEIKRRVNQIPYCSHCGSTRLTAKKCTGCSSAWYCNRECQAKDWKKHKSSCNKVTKDSEQGEQSGLTPKQDRKFATITKPDHRGIPSLNPADRGDATVMKEAAKPQKCCSCGKQRINGKKCSRCRNVWYCDEECQMKHWPFHKLQCTAKGKLLKTKQDDTSENKSIGTLKECDFCNTKTESGKKCSRCKISWYCDTECQKKDWSLHKQICTEKDQHTKQDPTARTDSTVAVQKCNCCGKRSDRGKKCSRCKTVWYCDNDCQEKDWQLHKHNCKSQASSREEIFIDGLQLD